MNLMDQYLQLQIEILESKLRVMERYKNSSGDRPEKRTSKIKTVEDILQAAGRPLHVSEIIEIANREYHVNLNRDSIVSNILKKVNMQKKFIKTGPNTFALKS